MPIRWKWNGKTVELQNAEPSTYAEQQHVNNPFDDSFDETPEMQDRRRALEVSGISAPESEYDYQRRVTPEEAKVAPAEVKRMWRKQLDQYWKGMKEDNLNSRFDAAAGMQELLDSGAAYEEEDGGLGTSVRRRGGSMRNDAMVRAHDAYVDYMKDQGNTAYDPDRGWYNPEIGMTMVPDASGRLIIRRPDGTWVPAYGHGEINTGGR